MKCNEILEHLNQYIEEDLTVKEMDKVREHLEKCDECRATYEEEKAMNEMFWSALNTDEVKFESRATEVMNSIDQDKYKNSKVIDFSTHSKKDSFIWRNKFMGIAAVFAIMVFMGPKLVGNMGMYKSEEIAMNKSSSMNDSNSMKESYADDEKQSDENVAFEKVEAKSISESKDYGTTKGVTMDSRSDEGAENSESESDNMATQSENDTDGGNVALMENSGDSKAEENIEARNNNADSGKDSNVNSETGSDGKVKGNTAIGSQAKPGVPEFKGTQKKFKKLLERAEYIKTQYGLELIDYQYVKVGEVKQDFGIIDSHFETFVEENDEIFIALIGTDAKTSKFATSILRYKRNDKKVKEIYRGSDFIKGLKIDGDKVIIDVSSEFKEKTIEIDR